MAIDVTKSKSAENIKNGTLLVYCSKTGLVEINNDRVVNTPAIESLETKYDHYFDDPSYYYGK